MLYLVSTPIGHLKDISHRAIETLQNADLILAEDTTVSLKLLNAYNIHGKVESYHKFTERSKLEEILGKLREGQNICLISDAGTPGICDPGALLVKACYEEGLKVTAIPGPSALSMAISLSGEEKAVQFLGFVPKKGGEKKAFLNQMVFYKGTSFAFDTPHQIEKTLEELSPFDNEIILFRELTKMFEEILYGSAKEVLEKLSIIKGEFVLAVKGKEALKPEKDEEELFKKLTEEYDLKPSSAVKLMSDLLSKNKRELYKKFIGNE